MTMTWFRWHSGTAFDPKWRVIARISGANIPVVISVWATMLENASESENRGTLQNWNPEYVAAGLDVPIEQVQSIYNALQGRCLDGNRLTGWDKRNPKREREDHSTERTQRHRQKQNGVASAGTPGNATEHPDKRRVEKTTGEEKSSPSPLLLNLESDSPHIPLPAAEKRAGPGPSDATVEFFRKRHHEILSLPYASKQGDFVQLAQLRQQLGVGTRASPPDWERAVENYLASALGSFTLADLCTRYTTFRLHRLDRYKQPIINGEQNGKHRTVSPIDRREFEKAEARDCLAERVCRDEETPR